MQPFDVDDPSGTAVWSVSADGTVRQSGGLQLLARAAPPTVTARGYLQLWSPDGEAVYAKDASGSVSVLGAGPGTGGIVWVNVKAYGATGNGTTDDTAAVQAAVNAAAGPVYFPPGTYLCSTLQMKTGTVLIGSAQSGYTIADPATLTSVIKLKSGTNTHLLQGIDGVSNVQLHFLQLEGNKANNSAGDLIHLDDAAAQDTNWFVVDCTLLNAPHDGIYIGLGRQAVKVNRTWINAPANNGASVLGSDAGFDTCLIGVCAGSCILVGVAAWVTHITDCDMWSSTHGIDASAGPFSLKVIGCGIDRHHQEGMVLGTGGDAQLVGTSFHSNSSDGNGTYAHIKVTAGALVMTSCVFGTSSATSLPSYCVSITGGQLQEWANYLFPGSVVTGYVDDPTKVINTFTGNAAMSNTYQFNVGASGSTASLAVLRALASDQILSGRITGNTVSRIAVQADGLHQWSNGTTAADVAIGRGGPNRLDVTTADVRVATIGRGLQIAEGSNARMGVTAAMTAGTITVATTAVTATSRIFLTAQTTGAAPGALRVSAISAGVSFTITSSSGTDTSTVAWMAVEAV